MKNIAHNYWIQTLGKLKSQPLAITGIVIIILFLFTAVFADLIAPYSPAETNLEISLQSPSAHHIFGCDDLGRDIFSRIIFGARISLKVAIVVMFFSMIIGTLLGIISGYFGGWIDEIIMRLTDIMMAFPGILLAIALMAVLGQSLNNVILALVLVNWKSFARLARAETLREKELEYIAAAKLLGFSKTRIMFLHILPNVVNPLIVNATLGMASVILAEAGLSFLGLGTPPDVPSWGAMLNEGRNYIFSAPHLTIFPGLAIMFAVIGFVFIGDSLRDVLDPNFESKSSVQL
jgi:peptide/nickel transport system permease protein